MRFSSNTLRGALSGPFQHYYVADIYYAGDRRLANLPISNVTFKEDANAKIQQSGSFTVVWTDAFGTSISPSEISDVLAPFGAEVYLYSTVWVGPFMERVSLGQFTITNVPSAMDEDMVFRGERITIGSTVQIEFKERLAKVNDDRFDVPTATQNLTSTWNEIGRLTELQLQRTITDKAIPRAVVYEENRLDATYDLFDILDAVPHMTADGALAARPNVWPTPVDFVRRGAGGTIKSVGRAMTPDQVYNRVAFRGKSGDQQVIMATAEVVAGPLRVRNTDGTPSPFRRKTYFVSSDYVTTGAEAQAYVNRELPRVSRLRSLILPVVETFNPLRERGDVITLERVDRVLTGRIISITRSGRDTQTMEVEIADD